MSGLFERSWKDTYKNVVIIDDSTWEGVKSTLTPLKDGNGGELPLSVSAGALMVKDTAPLYFGNRYTYIKYIEEDKLEIKAAAINVIGSGGIDVPQISASSMKAGSVVATNIRGTNAKFTGTVSAPTMSATTIKTTGKVVAGVISALSIKGAIDFTSAPTKSINMSGGAIVLRGGTQTAANAGGEIVHTVASTAVAKTTTKGFYPNSDKSGDLGGTASRWKNVYAASMVMKNLIASTVQLKGGSIEVSSVDVTATIVAASVVAKNFIAKDGRYYLDSGKTMSVSKSGTNMMLRVGSGYVLVSPEGSLQPSGDEEGSLGDGAKRFLNAHFINGYTENLSANAKAYLPGVSLFIPDIPSDSSAMVKGQVYQSSGILKVVQ